MVATAAPNAPMWSPKIHAKSSMIWAMLLHVLLTRVALVSLNPRNTPLITYDIIIAGLARARILKNPIACSMTSGVVPSIRKNVGQPMNNTVEEMQPMAMATHNP